MIHIMNTNIMRTTLAITVMAAASIAASETTPENWTAYGRDATGQRYSPLTQITRDNVTQLERAWTFDIGEIDPGEKASGWVFECTPLVVDGTMFIMTPKQRVIAIDAATGSKRWTFDIDYRGNATASRGVSYWTDGEEARIIVPIRDGRIYALNAKTGEAIESFGRGGYVHLRELVAPDEHGLFLSSPPAIFEDIIITGCGLPDGAFKTHAAPITAIDVRTGQLRWTFNTVPKDGEFGDDTWAEGSREGRGGANAWTILSIDAERGIVYVPTGAAVFDFYGGDRHGANLFANSLVALNARTGERLWHFQTIHHDLWDYDLPAQPNLIDITVDGQQVPAVAQLGKTGFVYVFNRVTGEPVWPIEERPVPASDVKGEIAHPTQPYPTRPPAISQQGITEQQWSRISDEAYTRAKELFSKYRSEGLFTPPSSQGSVVMPSYHGGGNWSGAAFDPVNSRYYVNTTELACLAQLTPAKDDKVLFRHTGWIRLRDDEGYPLNAPPWGKLVCIDMNRGEILWQKPLGEFEELTKRGIPVTGQENFGGATVTASGLVFIASTMDEHLRAFDGETGATIWSTKLPAGGYAAPVTYMVGGKQYIAICAGGGGKLETAADDQVCAYALP